MAISAPNPFYVRPGNRHARGLHGLANSLRYTDDVRTRKKAEAKFNKIRTGAVEAFKTKDPEKIAEFMIEYPEMAEAMALTTQFYDEQMRRPYFDAGYEILSNPEPENVTAVTQAYKESLIEKGAPPETIQELDSFLKAYQSDPDKALKKLEFTMATLDPKNYKAWKDVYKKKTDDVAPTELKKSIDERQALIEQGVPLEDERIQAYNRKISGRSTTVQPSGLKKLMDEKDALLASGVQPEDKRIKAYNSKIFSDAAKTYGPSPLKKLIKERQEYIEDGMLLDSEIIKAYDNKIAGIDIDIEEMTDEEIDMWGAWVNLSGKMPSVGRGKQATKIRARILKSAGRQALEQQQKAMGISDAAVADVDPRKAALGVVGDQADTKSIQGSLNFLEKQRGSMGSFIQNMDEQIGEIDKLRKDLFTFDYRLLNVPLRLIRGKILGSPLQAKYDLYLAEIEREISKLASNATSSIAAMSVEEVKAWSRIHDKALSTDDMWQLLTATRKATQIRMRSVEDELERTRTKMRTREYKKSFPNETDLPQVGTQEEFNALDPGTRYFNTNTGKPGRKP